MNLIRYSDARYEAKLARLAATSSLFDPLIEQRTLDIIRGVQRDGDKAVLNYTRQFDGASLRATDLAISAKRLAEAQARHVETSTAANHTNAQLAKDLAEAKRIAAQLQTQHAEASAGPERAEARIAGRGQVGGVAEDRVAFAREAVVELDHGLAQSGCVALEPRQRVADEPASCHYPRFDWLSCACAARCVHGAR